MLSHHTFPYPAAASTLATFAVQLQWCYRRKRNKLIQIWNFSSHHSSSELFGEVVASAEWQHADRGPRADAVQHAEHPAHGAVAAAR